MGYSERACIDCSAKFIPNSGVQKRCRVCAKKAKNKSNQQYRRKRSDLLINCKACGKLFKPSRSDREFCSYECKRDFCYYDENSFIDNVYMSEEDRLMPPTPNYIKEVDYLLKDFGIKVAIPQFLTVRDLDIWKRNTIDAYL